MTLATLNVRRLLPVALAVLLVIGGLSSMSAAQNSQETLEAWQQPGVIEEVNSSWACLVGSYHHTCTEWVNGAGQTVACDVAGCNPLDAGLECGEPSAISVLVANGTDVSGAAGRISGELNAADYVTQAPRNASPQAGSAFYYRTGHRMDAQCIARLLGESDKPLQPMPDPPPGGISLENLGNASILILIGPDSLAGINRAQRPGLTVGQPGLPDPNNLPSDVENLVALVLRLLDLLSAAS